MKKPYRSPSLTMVSMKAEHAVLAFCFSAPNTSGQPGPMGTADCTEPGTTQHCPYLDPGTAGG